jgi:subtilisin-like proprotein convertase family protein
VHLQVTLNNVNHTFPDDLDVLLVGPGGQSFVLQSDAGGNTSAVNASYTFDDTAPTVIPNDGGIPSATYKPANHQGNDALNDVFPAPAPANPYGNPGPQASGSSTLDGTFGGTNPNGTWSLYVTDDENLDVGNINGGWSLNISSITVSPAPRSRVCDFDGDNKTDTTVIRDSGGSKIWYVNRSTTGFIGLNWGTTSDVFVPQDYDGDGKTDIAVWRPSDGNWYILQSIGSTLRIVHFGLAGDDPTVVDDYDGDGKDDPAVVRNSGGLKTWYILASTAGFSSKQWGLSTDTPLPGDFDGDGKADLAVRRANQPIAGLASYYIDRSSGGFEVVAWGNNTDTIAPGDYDGDGKTDIAVVHPAGTDIFWYVRLSNGGIIENVRWGLLTDLIAQGDYDGDGKTDISVWRPGSGTFYMRGTFAGNFLAQFGQMGDYPATNYNTH